MYKQMRALWLLYHDNTLANTALNIRQFLAESNITALEQYPYSPDLVPWEFFLFPKLKGSRFEGVDAIK